MGKCHKELGQPVEAVGSWTKAVSFLEPCKDPEVFVLLGSTYLDQGVWDLARKHLVKSIDLLPTASAWYGAGVAAYRLEQYEEAYHALCEANAIDRERTVVWAWPSTWPALFHDIAEGFLALELPGPAQTAAQLA